MSVHTGATAPDPTTSVSPGDVAVRAERLTKRFGSRAAVDGLSFELPRGVVAGFIGPNGAGKTTTLAMLLGLIEPTSGSGEVLGAPLRDARAYLPSVGALLEGPAFYPGMTGADNLRLVAAMGAHDARVIPALLEQVALNGRGDDRYREYSLGMKQRLGIAAALLGDPQLLILDEPTNGLDPAGMRDIRELIGTLAREDRTVIVSSHILSEVEQVCDHLIMIDNGRGVYAGPASSFLAAGQPVIEVSPENPADLPRLRELLAASGLEVAEHRDNAHLSVTVAGEMDARATAVRANRLAHQSGIELAELHSRATSLQDRYLSLVEGASR